jgi:hypothetical protein
MKKNGIFIFLKNTRRTKIYIYIYMIASDTFFKKKKINKVKVGHKSWSLSSLKKHMEKLIIFYYISINFDSVLEIVFARLYSRKMVNNVVENAK